MDEEGGGEGDGEQVEEDRHGQQTLQQVELYRHEQVKVEYQYLCYWEQGPANNSTSISFASELRVPGYRLKKIYFKLKWKIHLLLSNYILNFLQLKHKKENEIQEIGQRNRKKQRNLHNIKETTSVNAYRKSEKTEVCVCVHSLSGGWD